MSDSGSSLTRFLARAVELTLAFAVLRGVIAVALLAVTGDAPISSDLMPPPLVEVVMVTSVGWAFEPQGLALPCTGVALAASDTTWFHERRAHLRRGTEPACTSTVQP